MTFRVALCEVYRLHLQTNYIFKCIPYIRQYKTLHICDCQHTHRHICNSLLKVTDNIPGLTLTLIKVFWLLCCQEVTLYFLTIHCWWWVSPALWQQAGKALDRSTTLLPTELSQILFEKLPFIFVQRMNPTAFGDSQVDRSLVVNHWMDSD